MQLTELVSCDLTRDAVAPEMTVDGWDAPEELGRRATSWRSRLVLPRPKCDGDIALILTVEPYLFPPILTKQTLRVIANGKTLKLVVLEHRTVVIAIIPADVVASQPTLEITFEHPDAVTPSMISASNDTRSFSVCFSNFALLAVAPETTVRRAAPPAMSPANTLPRTEQLTDLQLMRRFVSLGDNCEFGIAQRRAGVEVADLLRFAGMRLPGLLKGLDSEFDLIGRLDEIEVQIRFGNKREFVLNWRRYSMQMHTLVNEGDMSVPRFLVRELKKLQLQRRLMLDDLTTGNRIFVYKNLEVPRDADLVPLERSLRRYGPAALLYVVPAQSPREVGRVDRLRPGIMRGYIDRFNPYDNANAEPSPVWRKLCRNAYAMWRE